MECKRISSRCSEKKNFYEIIDVLEQLMGIEENIATRSEVGLILSSIQLFPFLRFLSFWGTVVKEINDIQEYMQEINDTRLYTGNQQHTRVYAENQRHTKEYIRLQT